MTRSRFCTVLVLGSFTAGSAMACLAITTKICDSTNLTCEQRCKLPTTCATGEIFPFKSYPLWWTRAANPGENGKESYAPYGPMYCQRFAYCEASGAACGSPGSGMVQCATPEEGDEVYSGYTYEYGLQLSGATCHG